MDKIDVTSMSSKGQVVIPLDVRTRLGLKEGDRFAVMGENDAIVLKRISMPSMADHKVLSEKAEKYVAAGKTKPGVVVKMLSEADRKAILRCAGKYDVSSVYVFGSSLTDRKAYDIDLGVKGIEPALFFKFYGELIACLSRPVDLVDLSEKSRFSRLVEEEGVKVYGRSP